MIQEIKEKADANEVIGLVIPDIEYDEMLIDAAGFLSKNYNKILYISINKPYESLAGKFKQNKIDVNKFYFVDCITRTAGDAQPTENCFFVSSPTSGRSLSALDTVDCDTLAIFANSFIVIIHDF